jgi:threonine/homoserine/homoserine lactone efflux protein
MLTLAEAGLFALTALLHAVPFAFDTLRVAGAAYLMWVAWDALRPGGSAPFAARDLPLSSTARLFQMGPAHEPAERSPCASPSPRPVKVAAGTGVRGRL